IQSFYDDIRFSFFQMDSPNQTFVYAPNVRAIDDDLREDCFAVSPVTSSVTKSLGVRLCVLLVVVVNIVEVFQQRCVISITVKATCISRLVVPIAMLLKVVTLQQITQRKLRFSVRHEVDSNEIVSARCHFKNSTRKTKKRRRYEIRGTCKKEESRTADARGSLPFFGR